MCRIGVEHGGGQGGRVSTGASDTWPAAAIIPERDVYVLCPGGVVTGGPEAEHQLVSLLASKGRRAAIVYYPLNRKWSTPQEYERYGCPVATDVPDTREAAVVVPEVYTEFLRGVRRARRVVWWLSVDHYRGNLMSLKGLARYARRTFVSDLTMQGAIHLCQSVYAQSFVRRRFPCDAWLLGDYIGDDFQACVRAGAPADRVGYNALKGRRLVAAIRLACPDVSFVGIAGMSRQKVREVLSGCKVYLDFGPHPGKDRMPREAALCGAVVVVGLRGAARNNQDVPLPPEYKLPVGPGLLSQTRNLILDIFERYEFHRARQTGYVESILDERRRFEDQVERIFGLT